MRINIKKLLISGMLTLVIFQFGCVSSMAYYFEKGVIMGQTTANDTIVEINDCAIPTLRYNNGLFIPVELLADYGFDVTWVNNDRTLIVDRNLDKNIYPYDFSPEAYAKPFNIISIDIAVYCGGMKVFSVNADDMVCINADDLAALYGSGGYDALSNRCKISLNHTGYGNVNGVSVTQNGVYSWWDGTTNVVVTQVFYHVDTGTYGSEECTVRSQQKGWTSLVTDDFGERIILGNVIKSANGIANTNYTYEVNYVMHPSNAIREIEKISGYLKVTTSTKYNYEQAMKLAQEVAKKQFGNDAIVLVADEGIATIVNIDGIDRACFMFGADSMAELVKNGATMRGLYHFDANTAEIFDNGSGRMVKVN